MTQENSWDKAKQFDELTSQSNRLLTLDELKMDSRDGKWYIKFKTKEKVKKGDKDVFEKKEISSPIDIIIIRANRRSLVKTGKLGKIIVTTREFTDKNKETLLMNFENKVNKIVKPVDIGNNGFKTINYIYCIYAGRLIKLVLKGGQVKTAEKIKNLNDYYSYIFSFKEERPYQVYTRIEPVLYSTTLGEFYTLNFKSLGSVSNNKEIDLIIDSLQEVKENLQKYDSQPLNTKTDNSTKENSIEENVEEETSIDYGETINPEDIPF